MNLELKHSGIGMTSQRTRDRLVERLMDQGISNISVLDTIRSTPRHIFVDEALNHRAYEDTALPIGHGQTISQPYTVARMTEVLLQVPEMNRVLEIGTGCGYQSSVLSQLVDEVFTVERILALLRKAREHFRELRVRNIRAKHSDGGWGWPENGPFDGIIVTCAAAEVPEALLGQLRLGGRMVIPVGGRRGQDLMVIDHTAEGFEQSRLEGASFVPLLGGVE